ncbi:type II toxin-antitoxin system HicA family toxin [Pseudomonas sp. BGI-2]|nr:type II toxin-antitoxin system HicA family toxin [Pseudomonas sp. BGI-2]
MPTTSSRVTRIFWHRPHSDKETKPYQVSDARAFLEQAGATP